MVNVFAETSRRLLVELLVAFYIQVMGLLILSVFSRNNVSKGRSRFDRTLTALNSQTVVTRPTANPSIACRLNTPEKW